MKPNILITGRYKLLNKKQIFYLDKGWKSYFKHINCRYMLYEKKNASKSFDEFDCLIISGGGDIYDISKNKYDKQRDKIELKLFNKFIKIKKPIILICRGFQLIASNNKNKIVKLQNHVCKNHRVNIKKNKLVKYNFLKTNSFHNYGIKRLNKHFLTLGKSKDKYIEMAIFRKNTLCLMFHPERINTDNNKIDRIILKQINNILCN